MATSTATAGTCISFLHKLKKTMPVLILIYTETLGKFLIVPYMTVLSQEYFARIYNDGTFIDCQIYSMSKVCLDGSKTTQLWSQIMISGGSFCFFFTAPLVGQCSDRLGRKVFIVLAQILQLAHTCSLLLYETYHFHLYWNFFIYFMIHTFSTYFVYHTTIVDGHHYVSNRTALFGMLHAFYFLGWTTSFFMIQQLSMKTVAIVAISLKLFSLLWSFCVVCETLPSSHRTIAYCSSNPFEAITILTRSIFFRQSTICLSIAFLATNGVQSIYPFLIKSFFSFSQTEYVHWLLLPTAIGSTLVHGILLKPMTTMVKQQKIIELSFLSLVFSSIFNWIILLVRKRWMLILVDILSSFEDLPFVLISSILSVRCSNIEQGRFQGALAGITTLSGTMGSLLFVVWNRQNEMSDVQLFLTLAVCNLLAILAAKFTLALPNADPLPLIEQTEDRMSLIESDDDSEDCSF